MTTAPSLEREQLLQQSGLLQSPDKVSVSVRNLRRTVGFTELLQCIHRLLSQRSYFRYTGQGCPYRDKMKGVRVRKCFE